MRLIAHRGLFNGESPKEENTNLSEEEKTTLAEKEREEFGKLSVWEKNTRIKNIDSNSEMKTMIKEKEKEEMLKGFKESVLKGFEESNNVGFMAANDTMYASYGNVSGENVQSSLDDFFQPF